MTPNRRELFKGLAAVLVAASIPLPVEALETVADTDVLRYLRRVRLELIARITHPPCIMHEDGRIEVMSTQVQQEALQHVSKLIKDLS